MFGGPLPPPSAAQLRVEEQQATYTIQKVLVSAVLLYLSPFAIDTIKKLV